MMKPFPRDRRIPEKDASQALGAAIANLEYAEKHIKTPKLTEFKTICESLVLTIKITRRAVDREVFLMEDAHTRYAMDAIPAKGEEDD
jgi:hypothetical protein